MVMAHWSCAIGCWSLCVEGSLFLSTLHHCGIVNVFTIPHKQSSEICMIS